MTSPKGDSISRKAASTTLLSSVSLPLDAPHLEKHQPMALIGGLDLQIEEHVQRQIANNERVRSNFSIGPDASTRTVVYFLPEHEFQRPRHPFSYRMRAFYHPLEHMPRHSQIWSIHTRVQHPYNLELYIIEDLTGAWPRFRPSPPPPSRSLPDLNAAPGEQNRVHYLPLLRDARHGTPEDVVVHVPTLRADEANRVYRVYLYPWSGARRSRSRPASCCLQCHVGDEQRRVGVGVYPEMPRCAVIAPIASAAGRVVAAHGADGVAVGPLTRACCEGVGFVADWIEACMRGGAPGYDVTLMPQPVDEASDGDWGPLLGVAPRTGKVGSRTVSDVTGVALREEAPFSLDWMCAPRQRAADVFDERSLHLLRLFARTGDEWRQVDEEASEGEETRCLGPLFDPRDGTKDLEDDNLLGLRRLFEKLGGEEELEYAERVLCEALCDEVYEADDEDAADEDEF